MIVKAAIKFLTNTTPAMINNVVDVVLEAMNVAKATFTDPVPSLAVVTTANDALRVAINEAADGSREKIAIRRAKERELSSLMRQLANYVTSTSNGDMAKLLASGFPHQKPARERIGELPAPDGPKIVQTNISGKVNVSVKAVYGASSYNWRLSSAKSPGTYLQQVQTTGSRVSFDGLTPGEVYLVEANAVGASGPSDFSTPGQLRVI